VENLDKIITIVKNWPNDMWVNCMPNKTLKVEGYSILKIRMLMVISTSIHQLFDFSLFFFFNKNEIFCCTFHFVVTKIFKYVRHVFSLESFERTWLGENQFIRVGHYGMATYWVSIWVFAWDYWGAVWVLVGQVAQSSQILELGFTSPTSYFGLRMCFRRVEKNVIILIFQICITSICICSEIHIHKWI